MNFRASYVHSAEYAVDDYSFEEGVKGNSDEGLDISKLGIAQDIVSSLAKRGITKLFPIQVYVSLNIVTLVIFLLYECFCCSICSVSLLR